MSNLKSSFRVSLILHALFILLLVGVPGCGGKGGEKTQGKGQGSPNQDHIVEKPIDVKLIDIPKDKGVAVKRKIKYTKRKCGDKNWFGGLGIEMLLNDKLEYIAGHVYKGYPADKAGLQDGDVLLNYMEFRGQPGTPVTIHYMRNGQEMAVDTIREKICVKGKP